MTEANLAGHVDYQTYYNLESYLFGTVHTAFRKDGCLSAFDFFCIIVWKANRAKSKIATKLLSRRHSDLDSAVFELTNGITQQSRPREKLRYLLEDWGFRLPMGSAILTVLYPEDFTVYDTRVCAELGEFANLTSVRPFDRLWLGYERFVERVREQVPDRPKLRDKDRYLWGKSFYTQLTQDIEVNFGHSKDGVQVYDPAI